MSTCTDYIFPNIRALFTNAFSEAELRRLCHDTPQFRTLYESLPNQAGIDTIVDRLLDHAERRLQIDILLNKAKELNPTQYDRHQPYCVSMREGQKDKRIGDGLNTILLVAVNPLGTDHLRLDEESRNIDQALQQTKYRGAFKIEQHWAVRISDLHEMFLRHNPSIVHFSGHGTQAHELVLEDDNKQARPVSVQALGQLFSILGSSIKCVLLNACYSDIQAQAIADHVPCVIGMTGSIGDQAAIGFSTAFYRALGYGKDVKTAFQLGCNEVNMRDENYKETPMLYAKKCDPIQVIFISEA